LSESNNAKEGIGNNSKLSAKGGPAYGWKNQRAKFKNTNQSSKL